MEKGQPSRIFVNSARLAIRLYQAATYGRPARCRFAPSCSSYMDEAIQSLGLLKGLLQGIRRILRCHPWNAGGYDPVTH